MGERVTRPAKPLSHTESSEGAKDEVEYSLAESSIWLRGLASFQERTSSLAEKLLRPEMDQNKDLLDYKLPLREVVRD